MTFAEFMEIFKTNKCVLHIQDSAAFAEVYAEITKAGLSFTFGPRSLSVVLNDKTAKYYPYLMVGSPWTDELKLFFCRPEGRSVIEPEDIVPNSHVANEFMTILGGG